MFLSSKVACSLSNLSVKSQAVREQRAPNPVLLGGCAVLALQIKLPEMTAKSEGLLTLSSRPTKKAG